MKYIIKRINEDIALMKADKIGFVLKSIKISIFMALVGTALTLYTANKIWIANDLILVAGVFVILNKLDNISKYLE